MSKTMYIEVPGVDARTAHHLVIPTLTHYGFMCTQASTKQSRNVAWVKVVARHCANAHEGAGLAALGVLPTGTQIRIDHRNPFLL